MAVRDHRQVSYGFQLDSIQANRQPSRREIIDQLWVAGKRGISARSIAMAISCSVDGSYQVLTAMKEEGLVIITEAPIDPEQAWRNRHDLPYALMTR